MSAITGIHHLSLTVRDAAASEEFYSKVFGFVRVLELPDSDGRGRAFVSFVGAPACYLSYKRFIGRADHYRLSELPEQFEVF